MAIWFACSTLFGYFSIPRIPWVIGSFILMFVDPEKPLLETRNLFFIRLGQDLLLCNYVIAGIWKLAHMFSLHSLGELVYSFQVTPLDHMSYVLASGSGNPQHTGLVLSLGWIVPWIFLLFIFLQFFSFLAIWKNHLKKTWAYALVLFHLSMGVVMGLPFDYTIAAIIFQIIFVEALLKEETLRSYPETYG